MENGPNPNTNESLIEPVAINPSDTHQSSSDLNETSTTNKNSYLSEYSQEQYISKPRGIRTNISFTADMTYEDICIALIEVFANCYDEACAESTVISDYLSVRDLRTIVRNLNLCDTSDLFNQRKPSLCFMIQSFLNQPFMKHLHIRNTTPPPQEEKSINLTQIDFFINKKDDDGSPTSAQSPKIESRQEFTDSIKVIRFKKIPTRNVESPKTIPPLQETIQKDVESSPKEIQPVLTPPDMNQPLQTVQMIQKINSLVTQMNLRISELEKAVEHLVTRLDVVEKIFKANEIKQERETNAEKPLII